MGHQLVVSLKNDDEHGVKGGGCEPVCKVFMRERVGRVWVSNREARREFNGMADDGLFGRSKKQGGRNHLLMAMGGKEASHLQILFFFNIYFYLSI